MYWELTSRFFFSDLLSLDHKACQNINSLTVPCQEDLKDMESAHSQKIVEISEISEKCLIKEYMVSASENALSTIVSVFFYFNLENSQSLGLHTHMIPSSPFFHLSCQLNQNYQTVTNWVNILISVMTNDLYVCTLKISNHQVEDHSCPTTIRTLNPPSMASIEELRTPAFEELLNIFRSADYSVKQPNRNRGMLQSNP